MRIVITNYEAISAYGNIFVSPVSVAKYVEPDDSYCDYALSYARGAFQFMENEENLPEYFCFRKCAVLFWAHAFPNSVGFFGGFVQLMNEEASYEIINEVSWDFEPGRGFHNTEVKWIMFDSVVGGNLASVNSDVAVAVEMPLGELEIRSMAVPGREIFFHAIFIKEQNQESGSNE